MLFTRIFLFLGFVIPICTPAHADTAVVLNPSPSEIEMNHAAFESKFGYNLRTQKRFTDVPLLEYFNEVYKNKVIKDDKTLFQLLEAGRKKIDEQYSGKTFSEISPLEIYNQLTSIASNFAGPEAKAITKIGEIGLKFLDQSLAEDLKTDRTFSDYQNGLAWQIGTNQKVDRIAIETRELMEKDPLLYGKLIEHFFPEALNGLNTTLTAEQIAKGDPKFAEVSGLGTLLNNSDNGKKSLTEKDIKSLLSKTFEQLKQNLDANILDLTQIHKAQDNVQRFIEAQQKKETLAAQFRDQQTTIEGFRSGFYLLSLAAKMAGNGALAEEIYRGGNAATTIAKAVNDYTFSSAGLSGFARGMSALTLAGNIAGALYSLTGTFMDSTTVNFDHIKQQLRDIQSSIESLRQQMQSYFRVIDSKLDAIYQQLVTNTQILVDTNRQVGEIRGSLISIQSDIRVIEKKMVSLFSDQLDSIFKMDNAVSQCMEGTDDPAFANDPNRVTAAKLQTCLIQAWKYATVLSISPTATGVIDPADFSPNRADFIIDQGEITNSLNYLFQMAEKLAIPGMDIKAPKNSVIPNLYKWHTGALAFLNMASRWPNYSVAINPKHVNGIIESGNKIREALLNLVTLQSSDGKRNINFKNISALLDHYRSKAENLHSEIAAFEIRFRAKNQVPATAEQLNFWQGLEQNFSYPFSSTTITDTTYRNDRGAWTGPRYDLQGLPPEFDSKYKSWRMAEGLGLGQTVFLYWYVQGLGDFQMVPSFSPNTRTSQLPAVKDAYQNGWVEPLFINLNSVPADQAWVANHWNTIRTDFSNNFDFFSSAQLRSGRDRLHLSGSPSTTTIRFQEMSVEYLEKAQIEKAIELRLIELRTKFAQELSQELKISGTLQQAAQALDGAKKIVSAFLELGLGLGLQNSDALEQLLKGNAGLVDSQNYLLAYQDALFDEKTLGGKTEWTSLTPTKMQDLKNLFQYLYPGTSTSGTNIELTENTKNAAVPKIHDLNIPKLLADLETQRVLELEQVLKNIDDTPNMPVAVHPLLERTLARLQLLKALTELQKQRP